MKGVVLLLGDFTFLEPTLNYPKFNIKQGIDFIEDNQSEMQGRFKAIINRIDRVKHFDSVDEAEKFGENELKNYESYLVLQQYTGDIEYDNIIDENSQIDFEKYTDLSYCDSENQENINLFIKGVLCGEMEVWLDVENNEREYVTINHEIIYLDNLTKQIL